jgi:hypothetical protein
MVYVQVKDYEYKNNATILSVDIVFVNEFNFLWD